MCDQAKLRAFVSTLTGEQREYFVEFTRCLEDRLQRALAASAPGMSAIFAAYEDARLASEGASHAAR